MQKFSQNYIILTQLTVIFVIYFQILGLNVPSVIKYGLFSSTLLVLILGLIKSHMRRSSIFEKLLLLWLTFLILTSFSELQDEYLNYIKLKQFLSGTLLIYVTPFLILSNPDIQLFKNLMKFQFYLAVLYIISTLPFFVFFTTNISSAEGLGSILIGGISLLIMTLSYHSKKKQLVILISIFLVLIINMINARRNQVVFFSSILFFTYFISILSKGAFAQRKKAETIRFITVFSVFISMIIIFFSNSFSLFWERLEGGMDSREYFIEKFIEDFDSHSIDWIIGRGIFGEFNGGLQMTNLRTGMRDVIENGYLFLILKGGWVYLGLLILVSIVSVYKGLFKSNNLLVKGLAAIIIIYFIDMIGFGLPSPTLKYILVFISIAGCNSESLRNFSDEYLSKQIGLK